MSSSSYYQTSYLSRPTRPSKGSVGYVPTVEDLQEIVSDRWRRPRNVFDEVYPRIYLGGEQMALDVHSLKRLGITHVLNAASFDVYTGEMFYKSKYFNCEYFGVPAMDVTSCRMYPYFEDSSRFIEDALRDGMGRVYVHCREGISRSATVVLAFLVKKRNMSLTEAIRRVRSKREIYPNDGFLQQLIDLETRLRTSSFRRY